MVYLSGKAKHNMYNKGGERVFGNRVIKVSNYNVLLEKKNGSNSRKENHGKRCLFSDIIYYFYYA